MNATVGVPVPPTAPVTSTGVIRFFNEAKGFGLITPDLGGPAVFAHATQVRAANGKKLKADQRVSFELQDRPEGPTAANIRMLA